MGGKTIAFANLSFETLDFQHILVQFAGQQKRVSHVGNIFALNDVAADHFLNYSPGHKNWTKYI